MASEIDRMGITAGAILGICVLVGLGSGGYFIGKGAERFRSDSRTVTVKGLVEREVKSDQAIWRLGLRRASNDIRDAQAKISSDRDAVVAFLQKQGFKGDEIAREPTRTIDKLAREFAQPQGGDRLRYIVTTSLVVNTSNVDLVSSALGATDELLKSGILLDGDREGGGCESALRGVQVQRTATPAPRRSHEERPCDGSTICCRRWRPDRQDSVSQSGHDPNLRRRWER